MQGAHLAQPSITRLIQGDQHRDDERRGDSNGASGASSNGSCGNGDGGDGDGDGDGAPSSRGVSIAYAGGGRQPVLHNIASLFHLGMQSLQESLGAIAGSTPGGAEDGGGDDDDEKKGKDPVPCHCLPGVRLMAALFFPLFLLSFFLLDDFGRALTRSMRLRNDVYFLRTEDAVVVHPVLRRKTLHEFPGSKRELIWIPLELTLNIDEATSFEATMRCPRAILFLFHGCSRFAASFFYSPQGRRIVSAAYRAGIAVVAFEKDDESGCWDWEADGEVVLKVGKKFVTSRLVGACGKGPDGEDAYPPMWAFGASSGGSFIAMLAARMEEEPEKYQPFVFSALNVQIMNPPEGLDWNVPTVFTVMAGDLQTKERVRERVTKKFQGGPFKLIVTSGRKKIHADHFAKLFADDNQMTPEISRDIHQSLVTMGIVDGSSDQLLANPRQEGDAVASVWEAHSMESRGGVWSRRVGGALPYGLWDLMARPLRPDEMEDADSIWLIEELNVAFDQHEITAEGFEEVLSFFDEFGSPR